MPPPRRSEGDPLAHEVSYPPATANTMSPEQVPYFQPAGNRAIANLLDPQAPQSAGQQPAGYGPEQDNACGPAESFDPSAPQMSTQPDPTAGMSTEAPAQQAAGEDGAALPDAGFFSALGKDGARLAPQAEEAMAKSMGVPAEKLGQMVDVEAAAYASLGSIFSVPINATFYMNQGMPAAAAFRRARAMIPEGWLRDYAMIAVTGDMTIFEDPAANAIAKVALNGAAVVGFGTAHNMIATRAGHGPGSAGGDYTFGAQVMGIRAVIGPTIMAYEAARDLAYSLGAKPTSEEAQRAVDAAIVGLGVSTAATGEQVLKTGRNARLDKVDPTREARNARKWYQNLMTDTKNAPRDYAKGWAEELKQIPKGKVPPAAKIGFMAFLLPAVQKFVASYVDEWLNTPPTEEELKAENYDTMTFLKELIALNADLAGLTLDLGSFGMHRDKVGPGGGETAAAGVTDEGVIRQLSSIGERLIRMGEALEYNIVEEWESVEIPGL
jgi:hypothetical protein